MADRRPLTDGLKTKPDPQRAAEEDFVFGAKAKANAAPELAAVTKVVPVNRVPFTTRIRGDLARALKRASLERQLEGVEPNQVQEILESALEPWLSANGYLT